MDVLEPWLLATLIFLVLVGSGRTLGGAWLAQPPFGAGVAISAALGVALFSLLWMGLGHFGALHAPWPGLILALGLLLALPGLLFTWRDGRRPAPDLGDGFGPAWFAAPAAFLLMVALVISMAWISGAFGWEGRSLLFERASFDYEIGRVVLDPERPRDPYLGAEPLGLWLFGLGSPEAALALSWWLGVALLLGVFGIGTRLHAQGAGLAAAALLAIVLFASDRPLLLAPALPASLALLAVMALAIEGRGRPRLGRSLVAGGLGGYALISDPGAATMLVPLLLFGPSWCKKVGDRGYDEEGRYDDDDGGEPYGYEYGYEGEDDGPGLSFAKKWATPLRHTAIGVAGLSLPLFPWLARSEAWTGDPLYAYREPSPLELRRDYRFDGYEPDYGVGLLDRHRGFDDYLNATEWGLGIGLLALLSPWYGWRRREPALYLAPGVIGYGLGAALGDCELTTPSSLALLSVGAGSTLYTARGCSPPGRALGLGGTLAAGGLSLALSGYHDCGYWDEFDDYEAWRPLPHYRYDFSPSREEPAYDFSQHLRFDPKLDFDLRYKLGRDLQLEEPTPAPDESAPEGEPKWEIEPQLHYELGPRLDYEYRTDEPPPDEPPPVPPEEESPSGPSYQLPSNKPKIPVLRPEIRPQIDVPHAQPRTTPPRPGYR